MTDGLGIRIPSAEEPQAFLARHTCIVGGPVSSCSCGWVGTDWAGHRSRVLAAWLEAQRLAFRAHLLAEEGVERP